MDAQEIADIVLDGLLFSFPFYAFFEYVSPFLHASASPAFAAHSFFEEKCDILASGKYGMGGNDVEWRQLASGYVERRAPVCHEM